MTYKLEDRPLFMDNHPVKVSMGFFGFTDKGPFRQGKIVGKSITHIIDYWLVEFPDRISETYPFRVLSVPHVAIIKE